MKKTLDIILILIKNVAFSNLRPFEKISYNKNQLNIPSLSLSLLSSLSVNKLSTGLCSSVDRFHRIQKQFQNSATTSEPIDTFLS